jgi:hypothetical protein
MRRTNRRRHIISAIIRDREGHEAAILGCTFLEVRAIIRDREGHEAAILGCTF